MNRFCVSTPTNWLTNSGCIAQALSTSNYQESKSKVTGKPAAPGNPGIPGISEDSETLPPTVRQTIMKAMSQQWQSDLCAAAAKDQPQHRPLLPNLGILAVELDEELQEEWEAENDVKSGPLGPHELRIARQKGIQYLRDREVCEFSTEAESMTRTGRNPVGLKWIDTNQGGAEATRYRSRLVCTEVRHEGVEPIFSTTLLLETLPVLFAVECQEDVLHVEDPFLMSTTDPLLR